jgi:soluble cytochrome b562
MEKDLINNTLKEQLVAKSKEMAETIEKMQKAEADTVKNLETKIETLSQDQAEMEQFKAQKNQYEEKINKLD